MSNWLNAIDVASPCGESWNAMSGDERARHCESCKQDVYDLGGLSRAEGIELVRRAQGGEDICVRFLRRADGTVLTADCPSQLQRARKVRKSLRGVAASAAALLGGALAQGCDQPPPPAPILMGKMMAPSDGPEVREPDQLDPAVGGDAACCDDGQGACCAPGSTSEDTEAATLDALKAIEEEEGSVRLMGKVAAPPLAAEGPQAPERRRKVPCEDAPPVLQPPADAAEAGGRRLPRAE